MRLLKFKILFAVCSCASLTCCKDGPVIDVCISSPEEGGFACVDKKKEPYFLEYKKSDRMIAFYPEDFRSLVEYCKLSKDKVNQAIQEYESIFDMEASGLQASR